MSGADWQLVGVDRLNSRVLGLAELSDLQLLDGHGQLSVLTSPAYWRTGLPIEFVSAFILEVFERFPLQKLYATVASVPQDPLGSLGERFTVEGHLRDYIRVDGVLRDAMIVAIERSAVLRQLERAGAIARVGDHSAVESGGLDGALPTSSAAALCAEWADRLEMTAGELLDVPMHALDSLDVLELVSVLEEQRGCAIAWEALAELQTVGEILGFAG
jgi:acyl carrier protein